jgi:hypothetical protein
MPRTPLPIGTWGEISTRTMKPNMTKKNGKPVKHLAHARFRDHDGKVRAVTATGTTNTAARTALLLKLQNRAKTNRSAELTAAHKVNQLLDLWERRFEDWSRTARDRRPLSPPTGAPSRTMSVPPSANSTSAKPPPSASTPSCSASRTMPAHRPPEPAVPSSPVR